MSRKSKNNHEVLLEEDLNLKKDFSSPTYEEWRKEAIKDLDGKSFEKKLISNTYEEIDLQPIYTKQDLKNFNHIKSFPGFKNYVRGTRADGYIKNAWEVCQEIVCSSVEEFNAVLKHDLQRGQTAVVLMLDKPSRWGIDAEKAVLEDVGKEGISISHLNDFSTALSGINLQKNPIYITAGFSSLIMILMFAAYARKKSLDIKNIRGCFEGDPLGFLVREGTLPVSAELAFDQMGWSIRWAKDNFPRLMTVGVNVISYHNSGASATQELAFAMATAVEYINQLQIRNLTIDDISPRLRFTFGVGPFFFMEIAKLRAAKILWSKIISEYGGGKEYQKINIHARTSYHNQSLYDPYVNMLRVTTESLSAIIGGIDSLHTSAFNESFSQPDEFSRRIARNTQLILEKEVHLRNPIDPAGGSYYVEALTSELAQKAWFLFQEIEEKGGMFQALQVGFPQKKIKNLAAVKNKDIARRKKVIVGTNMYAKVNEKKNKFPVLTKKEFKIQRCEKLKSFKKSRDSRMLAEGLKEFSHSLNAGSIKLVQAGIDAFLKGATIGEVAELLNHRQQESVFIQKLNIYRTPEIFEALRLKVEDYSEKSGSRPKIFLVFWGEIQHYKARADFSRGFFEVVGCDVVDSSGLATAAEIVKAAAKSQAQIVVFCSCDDKYPEIVPEMIRNLKKKRPEITAVVVGKPHKDVLDFKKTEIDEFIYSGVDLPSVLTRLMRKIGVCQP